MKVIFYTDSCFLDVSLEVINVLKKTVELHVLIEITSNSKNQNILDIDTLPDDQNLVHPSQLLDSVQYNRIEHYITGTASTNFLIYPSKNILKTLKSSFDAIKFIKSIEPDIIHVEGMLVRSLGILPGLFFSKKLFLSVHDPIPHLGERDWKVAITKFLFFNFPIKKSLFFYSEFAKQQFEEFYQKDKHPKWVIRMNPYSYFNKLPKPTNTKKNHILFFGRISLYKGIDVLLKAMELVFDEFPDEKLVLAGRTINDFQIDQNLIEKYRNNITLINRHISNEELVTLIAEAKFVVCPYLEATQSGVLMTANALDTPVIATNVGAFSEYITDNVTGLLVPVGDVDKLSDAIKTLLREDNYNILRHKLNKANLDDLWDENKQVFADAYLN